MKMTGTNSDTADTSNKYLLLLYLVRTHITLCANTESLKKYKKNVIEHYLRL